MVINKLSGISSSENPGVIDFRKLDSIQGKDCASLAPFFLQVSITETCWRQLPGVWTSVRSRVALPNMNSLKP